MSWGLVAVAGATVVGGALSSNASKNAAKGQQDAANQASAAQQVASGQATDAWNGAFDSSLSAQQNALGQYLPMQQAAYGTALQEQQAARDRLYASNAGYTSAGNDATAQLRQLMNFDPTPTAASVMAEPGYQAGLTQGRNALEGSAAASGGLYSGQALKELTQYGNDYATTKYGQAFDRAQSGFSARWGRIAQLAGMGQAATNNVNSADQAYANNIGSLATNNAQRQGSALLDAAGNETSLRTNRASAIGNLATGTANNLGNIYTNNSNAQGAAGLQQAGIYSNGLNQLAGLAAYGNGTKSTGNTAWQVGGVNGTNDASWLSGGSPTDWWMKYGKGGD